MKKSKQSFIPIIPIPVEYSLQQGKFIFNENTYILCEKSLEKKAVYFKSMIIKSTDFTPKIEILDDKLKNTENFPSNNNCLILIIDEETTPVNDEGYSLSIKKSGIILRSPSKIGIFYGIQSLRQLCPSRIESHKDHPYVKKVEFSIPCCKIWDYPRFAWRGFMLDEVRHFFGKTFVKRMIDLMALHKLNKLHWHLTDDEGWRIESKKFPKLNSIGSTRLLSKKFKETPNMEDPDMYGGYYTQEDLNEIIQFAAEHHIEVIPEIEMPGHATAPLVAYPEYSCAKPPNVVPFIDQRNRHAYCPGKKGTFEFLEQVLDEIIDIFPSDKIHIGGDELPKERWNNCEDCARYMKENNLSDIDELQVEFAAHIIKYLQKKGKTAIGWFDFPVDRLLDRNVDKDKLIFQFWVGSESKVVNFINKGGNAVISNHKYMYLDYSYFRINLKKAYNFDPIPKGLKESNHSHVLGMEPPIWCERVSNLQRMDYQVFPRLTAYAETAWTSNEFKDYSSFMKRLKLFFKRLNNMNIYYASKSEATNSIKARLIPRSMKNI